MKIAITIFPLDDLGGIINNLENQLWGLKELGHSVDFYLLSWQNKFVKPKYTDTELISNRNDSWYQGCLYAVHQMKGWNFPAERKLAYKGQSNLLNAKKILAQYDFVIWQVPVPTQQKQNRGNTDWPELYKANRVNVLYSHDAHFINNYPYVYEIKDYITGIASTNVASYNGNLLGGVQKALIFSSHKTNNINKVFNYNQRKNGWLSLQTFKTWKHVEELVRAVPYMNKMEKHLAGGGREFRYMTSKDKCKPEYYCSRSYDPDCPQTYISKKVKIWDRALEHNMTWHNWITPHQRDALLSQVKCLIDPSWSLKFAQHGDHFNRVFTDACIAGCIPIGRNYGVTGNSEGQGLIFKAGYNYIMVPHNATPKQFATTVNNAMNLPSVTWRKMIRRNYELVKNFDRKFCAQQFINLSQNKPAGFYQDIKVRKTTSEEIIKGSAKIMRSFFGIAPALKNDGIRRFFK